MGLGEWGLSPDVFWYLTPLEYRAIARGREARRRDEWERHLLLANMWATKPITYNDLTRPRAQRMNRDEFEQMKARIHQAHGIA